MQHRHKFYNLYCFARDKIIARVALTPMSAIRTEIFNLFVALKAILSWVQKHN